MNAKEFIKKFGWLVAIQQLKLSKEAFKKGNGIYSNSFVGLTIHKNQNHGPLSNSDFSFYFEELEMYIDARELVQSYGGMSVINHKDFRLSMIISKPNKAKELNKAITLIEEI